MMNTKLVRVVTLLCSALVLAGKAVESASDISFHTTPENVTIQAASTANIDEPTPIIGLVLGGFLGCLLLFALIGCGLICYTRCKRQQEDDKADIVHSFSNPSWIGSTDDTSEKTSKFTTENDYVDPVKLASKETTLKSLPDRDDLGGLF